jgi:AcrR family transcriptional regulator
VVRDANEAVPAASRRQERAAATRRRMMEAACRVFSAQGYGKATMDAIAAEAHVAVQTLYFTFHTKQTLLQAAYEFAVLGPDPVPPHLSDWWRSVEADPDVGPAVVTLVDGNLDVFARAAPLVWAVHTDPDAKDAYRFNENLRSEGFLRLIALLAAKRPLRAGLTEPRARDILLTLLGPATYMLLTSESSWTVGEYRTWVIDAILRELFD